MPESGEPILGDFRLLRELGRGGMGVVYLAEQTALRRRVALKVLPVDLTASPARLERFRREAEAAARLHHPNLIPIYAAGESGGQHWIAMEFVEGVSLEKVLVAMRSGKGIQAATSVVPLVVTGAGKGPEETEPPRPISLPSREAAPPARAEPAPVDRSAAATREHVWWVAQLACKVARALHHAHERGVIHRDVKPGNILLDVEGEPRVGDFGLARDEGTISITRTGDVLGTPLYMSPEQLTAKRVPVDRRTDVYSLGATVYQALTLEPPYPGESSQEVIRQILFHEPVPPRRLNPRAPRDLETVVLKALEKNPDRRYPTAAAMADDLARFLEGIPILARRAPLPLRVWRRARAVRVPVPAAIALGLAAAAVLALVFAAGRLAPEARARAANLAAVERMRAEDFASAVEEAQRAVGLQPRNAVYLETLADAHERSGNLATALVALASAVEVDPTLPRWKRLAEGLVRAGRQIEAAEPWNRVVAGNPRDADAHGALARIYDSMGDSEKAIEHSRRESALRREEAVRLFDEGEGDLESRARAALAVDPAFAPAHVALAREIRDSDPDAALKHLDDAIRSDDQDAEAWGLQAETLASIGRAEEALGAIERALALGPGTRSLRRLRAKLRLEIPASAPQPALEDLALVLAEDSRDAEAVLLLGRANAMLGKTQEARRAFEDASRLDPSKRVEALLGVALCDLRMGETSRALAEFQACALEASGDPRPRFLGALAQFQLRNFRETAEEASRAIAIAPGHARALALRASASLRQGRLRDALEDLERAWDLDLDASQEVLRWTLAEEVDWILLGEWALEPSASSSPPDPAEAARRFAARRTEIDPVGSVGEAYLRGRGTGADLGQVERLREVVGALGDRDPETRGFAERALRRAGLAALPVLEAGAEGAGREAVRALAEELRGRADEAADLLLAEWLLDEEGPSRVRQLGAAVSPALGRIFEDEDGRFAEPPRLRRNVRQVLAEVDSFRARGLAESLLLEGKTAAARREAASLLLVVGDTESVTALVRALEDPDALVRAFAAHALAAVAKGDAVENLRNLAARESDPLVRQYAAYELATLGDRDGLILVAYLQHRQPGEVGALNPFLLAGASEVGEEGTRDAEIAEESALSGRPSFLLRMFRGADPLLLAGALRLLGGKPSQEAKERLRESAGHGESVVRIPAAAGLSIAEPEEGRERLRAALRSSDPAERALAADEIVRLSDGPGIEVLDAPPESAQARRELAEAWIRRGDSFLLPPTPTSEEETDATLAEALARYAEAAQLDPSWWVPDARAGAAYHAEKRLDLAHAAYTRSLEKGAGEEGALSAAAFHLLECASAEAVPLFDRLVDARPTEAMYLAGRGCARAASQDVEGAKDDLSRVLTLPADGRSLALAAVGFFSLSEIDSARRALERASEKGAVLEDPRFLELLPRR